MTAATNEDLAVLDDAIEAWNNAGCTWNPEGISQGYTEDAVFFGGRPGLQQGRAAVRDYFASYVGTISNARLTLRNQALFRLAPDVVLAQGFGHFALGFHDGRDSETVQRTTIVITRRAGVWKILQHHFSTEPTSPPLGRD